MRHEDINALWVASDVMAYGFIEGLKASSLTLPSNTVIGSIDWSQETIEKIKTDALQISLGGHFLEGGQAIVLFHDYINGVDFADELGVVIKTPMSILDRNNVSELGALLEKPHWRADKIKSYSKFLNPSRANYQLNPKALILEQRK
jgi:ABC-type sugar transport system substrate-binding protein